MIFVIIVALMKTEKGKSNLYNLIFLHSNYYQKLNIKKETNESAKYLHTHISKSDLHQKY